MLFYHSVFQPLSVTLGRIKIPILHSVTVAFISFVYFLLAEVLQTLPKLFHYLFCKGERVRVEVYICEICEMGFFLTTSRLRPQYVDILEGIYILGQISLGSPLSVVFGIYSKCDIEVIATVTFFLNSFSSSCQEYFNWSFIFLLLSNFKISLSYLYCRAVTFYLGYLPT